VRLLLACGETSGDLYGAELVRNLDLPALSVFGLGGDRLASEGMTLFAHTRDLAVVGLVEVLAHLGRLRSIFQALLAEADRDPPAAAVLIDYPDFNLRLARELKARKIPVVYYVSPQLWAWRRGRIRQIQQAVSRMLVIFPFEEALYREAGVSVTFVGHPLVDLVSRPPDPSAFLRRHGLDPSREVVALLPGSRPREVAHNLPPLKGAVERLRRKRGDLQFTLAAAPGLSEASSELSSLGVRVIPDETPAVLASATLALVASGTATVEAALLGTPMVVVYRLSPLTYALGRPFVRVPHFAMVNLIAGREIVPELIQGDFTPDRVARECLALLEDPPRLALMRRDLAAVVDSLGGPGASARAARAVLEVLNGCHTPSSRS
jgi:lipid-A-disaccharide synthase